MKGDLKAGGRTMKAVVASLIFVFAAAVAGVVPAAAPEGTDVLAELESVAVIDQKVMVPMRDGIPMSTSNYFDAGHRIRIEVSSSNFQRFTRNLNTGGNNYDETEGVVAHNTVHHSRQSRHGSACQS